VKAILLALLFCASVCAQSLSIVVHDPTGRTPDAPLTAAYPFPDTRVYSGSSVVLRISNPSSTPVELVTVMLSNGSDFTTINPNFTITGLAVDKTLSPNSSNFDEFTVNFTPTAAAFASGILQAIILKQQNGCSFSSTSSPCPSDNPNLGTVQGTGLAPSLMVSYSGPNGSGVLYPDTTYPLNFGNISTGATSTINFTLSNQTSTALTTPTVALQTGIFLSSAFSLTASALPASIPANSSVSFSITFAPGQTGLSTATLMIGQNFYPMSGTGIVVADTDALQISYSDANGVRTLPQAATPISFGQVAAGASASSALTFYVTNPSVSFNPITVSTLTASGAGFSIASAPATPVNLQPGQSISFQLVFSPSSAGTYTGTLSIGTRQFSLTAKSASSLDVSFQIDQSPLASQQQAHLSLQLSSPAPVKLIPTLTMEFMSLVSGITNDPAINFLASSGRQLQITFDSGSQTGTFNGQSALTFQTGTTAGTLKFTLAFPDGTTATKSFTVTPAAVQITSAQALRQSPNLVLNLTGYDNTYSIGNLVFTFYDTDGKVVTPNGISVEAGSSFHQFFFTNNQTGGAFTLQAKFPVNGDVTKIGSVSAAIANSVAATTSKSNFQ
ncbi:MAG TPA: choice-of-anchor D domain-containing protein, partial [Bryobacteraceae bacterium]|nr:choice-of-anchor D domain-containing protein [Bryobacteraceae bacterium]